MEEQWQLCDEQGRILKGQGAGRSDILSNGILHCSSHVWIWRDNEGEIEVLVQKRAPDKYTWPSLLDISAAGHVDLDEEPIDAAIRETKEEIGIDIAESDLKLIAVNRSNISTPNGAIENEFRWVYIYKVDGDLDIKLQDSEVESTNWISLSDFKNEVSRDDQTNYVPHGSVYYNTIVINIELAAS